MKKHKYQQRPRPQPETNSIPREYVDLHMHTTWSDGDLSTTELLKRCIRENLKAIAITDHDCFDGYIEAKELLRTEFPDESLEVIPGIELSTVEDGSEVHILGYYFDVEDETLNNRIKEMQNARQIRAGIIVDQLRSRDVDITLAEVQAKSTGTSIGRPHVAAVLIEKGYAGDIADAFKKYLSYDVMRAPKGKKMSSQESIDLIASAGGISVLAHPAATGRDDLLERLTGYGLQGMEVYRPRERKQVGDKYHQLAEKLGLVKSGGSDFHSERKGYSYSVGCAKVPYSVIEEFKKIVGVN